MESFYSRNDTPLKWQTLKIFSKRARPLEIFIENKSKHILELDEDFFNSGEQVDSTFKDKLAPGSSCLTLVTNKSTGVSVGGGLKYRLREKGCFLYLGFSNPCFGGQMSFVCLSNVEHTAKWAYEEAKDGFFKSCPFEDLRAFAEMVDGKYCPSKRIVFSVE